MHECRQVKRASEGSRWRGGGGRRDGKGCQFMHTMQGTEGGGTKQVAIRKGQGTEQPNAPGKQAGFVQGHEGGQKAGVGIRARV